MVQQFSADDLSPHPGSAEGELEPLFVASVPRRGPTGMPALVLMTRHPAMHVLPSGDEAA